MPFRLAFLALAASCGGCGTMQNLTGYTGLLSPPEPPRCEIYGGIQKDLECGRGLIPHASGREGPESFVPTFGSFQEFADYADGCAKCTVFFAIDLPLTLIADTLTLPITIEKTLEKRKQPPVEATKTP